MSYAEDYYTEAAVTSEQSMPSSQENTRLHASEHYGQFSYQGYALIFIHYSNEIENTFTQSATYLHRGWHERRIFSKNTLPSREEEGLSEPVSVADMINEIKSVFGLSVVQIADITGISRPAIYKHLAGENPNDPSAYKALHDVATSVRQTIQGPLKPGLKSVLVEGKTLLAHLKDSYRDRDKILTIARQIEEKLDNVEPRLKNRPISEQRRAVMTIGKNG